MDEALFQELTESIREMGAHLRAEHEVAEVSSERIHFVSEPDPRAIRAGLGVSQEVFASLLGISPRTLQNWEQGRRTPQGPALKLLQIAERRPDVLLELAERVGT
ncbi:MAG: helix-turn-helix domain-containing protein [Bacteroidota bacterium]